MFQPQSRRSPALHRGQSVQDPARLAVLRQLALLDSPTEEAFDRLTRLATKLTHTPISLVSLVDKDRQFYKSAIGLDEPWASRREAPLEYSFCQHVVTTGEPLIIQDTREHEWVKDNRATLEHNVISYVGMPLTTSDGYELGSFCVVDKKPRDWTAEEIAIMDDLAASALAIIELRGNLMDLHAQAVSRVEQLGEQIAAERHHCEQVLADVENALQNGARADEIIPALKVALKWKQTPTIGAGAPPAVPPVSPQSG